MVLEERQLSRQHIDQVCELFAEVEAGDIFVAFEILCKLQTYYEETQSWSFKLLAQYEFDAPPNEFEFDLAKMINQRSRSLLNKMGVWDITGLRDKVQRLPQLSDWGMVLTSLVLRIMSVYAKVEFNLRLALSRSTLVRIHCELAELIVDQVDETGSTLVNKYRSFVSQLLREMEEAPTIIEQEKMFKTVNDLHHMFSSFKDSQRPASAPVNSSPSCSAPSPPSSAPSSAYSSSSSSSSATASSSTLVADGLLSNKVLGAFDSARTEQKLARLRTPVQPSPSPPLPAQTPQNLNVKMVDGRMQVYQNGGFVDMQDWLDSANNVKVDAHRPAQQPHPFGSVPSIQKAPLLEPQAPSKPNIASSAFLQAMRTGRW